MLSQIIFFIAVALLIILLARRIYAKGLSGKVGEGLYNSGHAAARFVSNFWQRTVSAARSRSRARSGAPTGVPVTLSGEHQFWQEEPMSSKPELSSHFEEGDRLLKEKKYTDAEQFFLKAASNNPKDPKPYAKLGLIY